MLWVCLFFPDLPLEVFTRAQASSMGGLPFAIASGGHYPYIIAPNQDACAVGVTSGQLVSAALAFAPGLVLRNRLPQAEYEALASVATWLSQFTPDVSLAPPQALLAEVGGSLQLFGGLTQLLQYIKEGVQQHGFSLRCHYAPTPAAALLLARADQEQGITHHDDLDRVLAPLSIVHLATSPESVATLRAAGVTTFGAACALPRAGLARRVGSEFVALLDRARGHAPDPQLRFTPPARYEGKLELPVPVSDAAALGFAVNRLVHELAGWLLARGHGVLELALVMTHEHHMGVRTGMLATTIRFALASPTREPAHLTAVLRERLARVELLAPVANIVLASDATTLLAGCNLGLLPGDEAVVTVPLLDRLRARLGEDAVLRVTPQAEHRPERAWQAQSSKVATTFGKSAASRPHTKNPATRTPPKPTLKARTVQTCGLPLPPGPRPLWLLSEPQPLGVTFADRPWVLRDGPERIESGWWDGADIRRDYFTAENPGGELLWIYRDSRHGDDGEWFLQGVFA